MSPERLRLEIVSLQTDPVGRGTRWESYGHRNFKAEPLPGDRIETKLGQYMTVKSRRFQGGKMVAVEVA